jgi:hypothetical protein
MPKVRVQVAAGDRLGQGTGRIVTNSYGHRPFEEARAFARSLCLKNSLEWLEFCKSGLKPKDIPYQPFIVYKVAEDSCLRHGAGQLDDSSRLPADTRRTPKGRGQAGTLAT